MSTRNSVLHHSAHFVMNPANMITAARIAASPLLFITIQAKHFFKVLLGGVQSGLGGGDQNLMGRTCRVQ